MRKSKLPLLIVVVLLTIVCAGLAFAHFSVDRPSWTFDNTPIPIDKLTGQGDINFVAFDEFPPLAEELVTTSRAYGLKYGINARVISGFALPSAAWDAAREQYVAEDVVKAIAFRFPKMRAGRPQIYIALTNRDIFIRKFSWQYAFAYRDEGLGVAVISIDRMWFDYRRGFSHPVSREVMRSRLYKMMTKQVGVLYFGLPLSNNPRNVMFDAVGGPQELDVMGDDFLHD